jgi:thiol-disulfide isomerase/thioredoxin
VSGFVLAIAIASTQVACNGSSERPANAAGAKRSAQSPLELYPSLAEAAEPIDLDDIRFVGMDDGPVPEFQLKSVDGRSYHSDQLVGDRAFVFVFFATWCNVCDKKLAAVRRALNRTGKVTMIGVSADDQDTWPAVMPFVKEHGLEMPIVPALKYPKFAISYNPFQTVPLVVVVGRNGGLVDYQLGYQGDDEDRFVSAVQLARRIGPLKSGRPN